MHNDRNWLTSFQSLIAREAKTADPVGELSLYLIFKGTALQEGGNGRQLGWDLYPFYLSALIFYDSPLGPPSSPTELPHFQGSPPLHSLFPNDPLHPAGPTLPTVIPRPRLKG